MSIALVKEHFEHIKVEKLKDSYKNELQKIEAQIDMAEQTIGGQVYPLLLIFYLPLHLSYCYPRPTLPLVTFHLFSSLFSSVAENS